MSARPNSESKRRVRKTLFLVLIAASLTAGAAYLLRDRGQETSTTSSAALVPSLGSAVDGLTLIEIASGSATVTLTRENDRWVVQSAGGHPADVGKVAAVVQSIAALTKDDALTAKRERHDELGLAWPDASGRAKLVRLRAGDAAPMEIVLGDTRGTPPTTYARLLAEDQTWRCDGIAAPEANAVRYMNPQIVALPADDVKAVRYLGLVVTRGAQSADATQPAGWESTAGPGPIDPGFWPDAAQAIARTTLPSWLARLEFDDVRRRGDRWTPDPALTIEYDTETATIVVESMREGDAAWARLRAVRRSDVPADAAASATDWVAWSANVEPWEYKLPSWKVGSLLRIREEPKQ